TPTREEKPRRCEGHRLQRVRLRDDRLRPPRAREGDDPSREYSGQRIPGDVRCEGCEETNGGRARNRGKQIETEGDVPDGNGECDEPPDQRIERVARRVGDPERVPRGRYVAGISRCNGR